MTLDDWVLEYYGYPEQKNAAQEACWDAAQAAERERIKSRVKEAAESIWATRDLVDNRYGLYIGPPLNTLEQFIEKLMEEE